MSDIPEAFMKAALTIAATSPTLASDIARALMAADEAATKRERERIASQFTAEATAIEVDEHENAQWGGPDPRGGRVRHLRLEHAKSLRARAAAILKGEA